MKTTIGFFADEEIPRARVAALLQHFAKLEDDREAWRVAYPLAEVLLFARTNETASRYA